VYTRIESYKRHLGHQARNEREKYEMEVFAFEGSARKDGDTAQSGCLSKTLIKVMTVVMQFLNLRGEVTNSCVFGHNGLQLATPMQEDYEKKD